MATCIKIEKFKGNFGKSLRILFNLVKTCKLVDLLYRPIDESKILEKLKH